MGAFTDTAATAASDRTSGHDHDWDWFIGQWRVRHRVLKARLSGCDEWEEFDGATTFWPLLGGLGNVDDNLLEAPGGTYRAVTLRAFDDKEMAWRIWWLDGRDPSQIGPPVKGRFTDGVGTFEGDDYLHGKPIRVRFIWSQITPTSAVWEQAFSPDAGATWELNWIMQFTRTVQESFPVA